MSKYNLISSGIKYFPIKMKQLIMLADEWYEQQLEIKIVDTALQLTISVHYHMAVKIVSKISLFAIKQLTKKKQIHFLIGLLMESIFRQNVSEELLTSMIFIY